MGGRIARLTMAAVARTTNGSRTACAIRPRARWRREMRARALGGRMRGLTTVLGVELSDDPADSHARRVRGRTKNSPDELFAVLSEAPRMGRYVLGGASPLPPVRPG